MMWRWASMKPGIAVMPRASIVRAPAALAAPAAPTEAIRPLRTTIEPCSITWPLPTMMRTLVMTRSCADRSAEAATVARQVKTTSRSVWSSLFSRPRIVRIVRTVRTVRIVRTVRTRSTSRTTRTIRTIERSERSELVLHRELHDARIVRRPPTCVLRMRPKLTLLRAVAGLPQRNQLKALNASMRASMRCVEKRNDRTSDRSTIAGARPDVGVAARVPERAERRLRERRRIQPAGSASWRRTDRRAPGSRAAGPGLPVSARSRPVVTVSLLPDAARKVPESRQSDASIRIAVLSNSGDWIVPLSAKMWRRSLIARPVVEVEPPLPRLRRRIDDRHRHHVPAGDVGRAAAARRMALAFRQRVVGADADPVGRAALNLQQQPVVLLRAGVGEVVEEPDEAADRRIRLRDLAARIERRRRAVGERLRSGRRCSACTVPSARRRPEWCPGSLSRRPTGWSCSCRCSWPTPPCCRQSAAGR